jgi:formate dehydrogenase subunit delta
MSHSQFDDEDHIVTSNQDRLVYMANQIARFFVSQPHDQSVHGIVKHISDFWDPRMRQNIREYLNSGGDGLEAITREAISALEP